ncbi:MAG: SEC-C domain-containing protein [Bacteroidetes bacterium]|nr:SEC-C domain-containing protein [Bacteroidota bacterium]
MLRSTSEILDDLKVLIKKPGYIYSLCLILFEDFHHDLNKIHEVDYRAKLSVKECSLIIGFLVQGEIDFSFPESPELTFNRKEQTYLLMEELHFSFSAPQFAKLRDMQERQQNGEVFNDDWAERLNFFVKDRGMVEPMFYAGDGVYDFQYLEYLEMKYQYDQKWLTENKGFDITKTQEIVSAIKQVEASKARKVLPINVKEMFPEIAARARNKLKKHLSKERIDEIEKQNLIAASFYRYRALFPDSENTSNDNSEGWKRFCQNLLDLFIIKPSDLNNIDPESVKKFFDNFSFLPPSNEDYYGPGHYNVLNSHPLIELENKRYFLPIGYLLPEAVYESPFYWMWEDKKYRDDLAKHRGDVGEKIAYDLLCEVFGKENTYRSVLVEIKKGQRETDIDVLCILGNKALCVQVKSKKLTLTAKRGDFDQLSKDFNGAVQDAYDQGLISRDALLKRKAKFVNAQGNEIHLPEAINEVYLMGLTTENYPALAHQVHLMLVKKNEDPFPLVVSVFDLELLAHYLKDPYDFLYYVRQRTALMEYFRADEELIYLGYHLDQKLWPREGCDFVGIDTDFGGLIDRNYYPYKTGLTHFLVEKDDPIHNRHKDTEFDIFMEAIKSANNPKTTDIIFHLLDWSGVARKEIVAYMKRIKQESQNDGKLKSLATPVAPQFGISYVVTNNADPVELGYRVITYARLRKYLSKSHAWLGIGAFSTSPNLVDTLVYLDEFWQRDPKLEVEFQEELSKMKSTRITPMKGKVKIGRNDPCPCQSGKKFKNCCMS